ncbi:MAG: hypothetical protein KAJ46_05185, partial [Sedimentisphaerales bacterium]|nr:hypothetical protein [Sedimentisphaerales bacterium]
MRDVKSLLRVACSRNQNRDNPIFDGKCKKEPKTMSNNATNPSLSKSPEKEQNRKKGADIFCDVLQSEGVETMFGYPGGVVLPLFDSLYDSPINFVLSRHEQGAT